jgi:hypothetical protein
MGGPEKIAKLTKPQKNFSAAIFLNRYSYKQFSPFNPTREQEQFK